MNLIEVSADELEALAFDHGDHIELAPTEGKAYWHYCGRTYVAAIAPADDLAVRVLSEVER